MSTLVPSQRKKANRLTIRGSTGKEITSTHRLGNKIPIHNRCRSLSRGRRKMIWSRKTTPFIQSLRSVSLRQRDIQTGMTFSVSLLLSLHHFVARSISAFASIHHGWSNVVRIKNRRGGIRGHQLDKITHKQRGEEKPKQHLNYWRILNACGRRNVSKNGNCIDRGRIYHIYELTFITWRTEAFTQRNKFFKIQNSFLIGIWKYVTLTKIQRTRLLFTKINTHFKEKIRNEILSTLTSLIPIT